MAKIDKSYKELLNEILSKGYKYEDPNRKGVKRLEIPSYTFRHEFKDGFPAITTKKLFYKQVVTELIWFLRGDTNIKYLVDNNCNIWNKDAYNYYVKFAKENNNNFKDFDNFIDEIKVNSVEDLQDFPIGLLGRIYGTQWRRWQKICYTEEWYDDAAETWYPEKLEVIEVDQIKKLITNLKEKPLATDHIVSAWNTGDLDRMALPPCHYGFQVVVKPLTVNEKIDFYKEKYNVSYQTACLEYSRDSEKYGFELHWNQRSVDTFLGLPYNIASYATLAKIIEKLTGYKALAIQGDLKKVHLYDNSLDAVNEQLNRNAGVYKESEFEFSPIGLATLDHTKSLNELFEKLEPHHFILKNYESFPHIKVDMLEKD